MPEFSLLVVLDQLVEGEGELSQRSLAITSCPTCLSCLHECPSYVVLNETREADRLKIDTKRGRCGIGKEIHGIHTVSLNRAHSRDA